MSIHNHAPLHPNHDDARYVVRMWCLLVGLPCLALVAIAITASVTEAAPHTNGPTVCGVEAQNAGTPHDCLITQCAAFGHCEDFVIPAYPKVGELGEATANHMVEVETCVLSYSGNANNCSVRFAHKGDQIIAWHS